MRKKIFSLALVVCMIVSMLPTMAFAADATGIVCKADCAEETHLVTVVATPDVGAAVYYCYTGSGSTAAAKRTSALEAALTDLVNVAADNDGKALSIKLEDNVALEDEIQAIAADVTIDLGDFELYAPQGLTIAKNVTIDRKSVV